MYKRQEWDFCEELMALNFTTNCAAVNFVKSRMSSNFPNRPIPATLVRPRVQKVPGKFGETSPAGYISTRRRLSNCPRTRWRNFIPVLAWSRLCVKPSKLSGIAVKRWSNSSSPRAAVPVILPRGKLCTKVTESIKNEPSLYLCKAKQFQNFVDITLILA